MRKRPSDIEVRVVGCARCGGAHDLRFSHFSRAAGEFTHWSECPLTGEPILLAIVATKTPSTPAEPPARQRGR